MGLFGGIKKLFQVSNQHEIKEQNKQKKSEEKQELNTPCGVLLSISKKPNKGGKTMATAKDMEKLLAQVVKDNGLEGAVISDFEGLPLASYLPTNLNEDEVAAIAAAIIEVGDSKLPGIGKGKVVQASLEAEGGYIVIAPMKNEFVVSVLAPKEVKLGIILSAIRSIEKGL